MLPESSGSSGPGVQNVRDKEQALAVLDSEHVSGCRKCTLCQTRTNTVFGTGSAVARLMFIGEAPGFHEDQQGIPFVGRAGDLLTRMIAAMGLKREEVYIGNVLKCRPPDNRDPAADEVAACSGYLFEQISIVEPEVIVALGAPAVRTLLNTTDSIGRLRGRFHDFHISGVPGGDQPIPLMPTYHPAYLLRSPREKAKAWADLQAVMQRLGLPPPK
ncbi:MAG: uracil-DNA glycosylase [Phycisphaerae bacterium]